MPVIVKFESDCNDEFTASGFRIFETSAEYIEWECSILEEFLADGNERELYVGTNDFILLTKDEYFNEAITADTITDAEYDFLKDNIVGYLGTYGMFLE